MPSDLNVAARAYLRNLLVRTPLGCAGDAALALQALQLLSPDEAVEIASASNIDRAILRLREIVASWKRRPVAPVPAPSWLSENLAQLGTAVGLSPAEREILQFLAILTSHRELSDLASERFDRIDLRSARRVVASAVGAPARAVAACLGRDATLVSTGLVRLGTGLESLASAVSLSDRALDLLTADGLTPDAVMEAFAPRAPAGSLSLEDYEHLDGEVEVVQRLLVRGLDTRARGLNVLLHGPVGTGKTELAYALAKAVGVQLYRVGLADELGESPMAFERLRSLSLASRLVEAHGRGLLLFDEMEDLFGRPQAPGLFASGEASMSKQWFNRVLEENPVPVLWITNEPEVLDPAYRRRFAYAIRFGSPDLALRRRLWRRHTQGYARVDERDVESLAACYDATPGNIRNAVQTGALLARDGGPSREEIEAVLRPTLELAAGDRLPRRIVAEEEEFEVDALNADADLAAIAERLASRPRHSGGVSLCLFGPSGTGKSAYARYLARRMGRDLVVRAASDLVSPLVGETERNLAHAFDEAARADAVLLFDEVDSFLRSRDLAMHSWEITEVNEFLRQLEMFPGVVVCTTNRFADLDAAVLRRFVFKIRFDWLRPGQAAALFRSLLGPFAAIERGGDLAAAERLVSELDCLGPGDFVAVRRRVSALGARLAPLMLAEELVAERAVKGDARDRVGFRA